MSASKRFQVIDVDPEVLQVCWFGDLTAPMPAADAEQIALAIDRSAKRHDRLKEIHFELTQCEQIDSRGIALLVFVRRHMARRVEKWRIVGAPQRLVRMLELMNLQNVFVVEKPSADEVNLLTAADLGDAVESSDEFSVELDPVVSARKSNDQREATEIVESISWEGLVAAGGASLLVTDEDSSDDAVLDQVIVSGRPTSTDDEDNDLLAPASHDDNEPVDAPEEQRTDEVENVSHSSSSSYSS